MSLYTDTYQKDHSEFKMDLLEEFHLLLSHDELYCLAKRRQPQRKLTCLYVVLVSVFNYRYSLLLSDLGIHDYQIILSAKWYLIFQIEWCLDDLCIQLVCKFFMFLMRSFCYASVIIPSINLVDFFVCMLILNFLDEEVNFSVAILYLLTWFI